MCTAWFPLQRRTGCPPAKECSQLSSCQLHHASLSCRQPAPPKSHPSCDSPWTISESGGDTKVLSLQQGMRHPTRWLLLQSQLLCWLRLCQSFTVVWSFPFAQSSFFYSQVSIPCERKTLPLTFHLSFCCWGI